MSFRKFLLGILLGSMLSVSIIALDKMDQKDRTELKTILAQIDGVFAHGPVYFAGYHQGISSYEDSKKEVDHYINTQISVITKILDRNLIEHPQNKSHAWLKELSKSLQARES